MMIVFAATFGNKAAKRDGDVRFEEDWLLRCTNASMSTSGVSYVAEF